MKVHKNIKITGIVQGVYFRATTWDKARELGVKGFVRNQADGSVYIEAEGDEAVLKKFIDWCHSGPAAARVDQVEVDAAMMKSFRTFEIRTQITQI